MAVVFVFLDTSLLTAFALLYAKHMILLGHVLIAIQDTA